MNNKIMVGVLVACLFLAVSAHAKQKQESPQEVTADGIVAKMKGQLDLTDNQVDEVKPIIENYLAREKELKLEEKKELKRVLTGQQMFTWDFLQNPQSHDKKKHTSLF